MDPTGGLLGAVTYVPGPGDAPVRDGARGRGRLPGAGGGPGGRRRGLGRALPRPASPGRARRAGRRRDLHATVADRGPSALPVARLQRDARDWEIQPGEWLWSFTSSTPGGHRPGGPGRPRPSSCSGRARPGSRPCSPNARRPWRSRRTRTSSPAAGWTGRRGPGLAVRSVWSPADGGRGAGRRHRAGGRHWRPTSRRSASCSRRRGSCSPTGGRRARRRGLSGARSALVRGDATFRRRRDELDLRLRTDLLVPLSRWVTPRPIPAPLRHPVLRRGPARRRRPGLRGRRGRRARLATPGRRRSRRWRPAGSGCGCRRARPSSSSST